MPSSRRDFLKSAAIAGAVAATTVSSFVDKAAGATPPVDKDLAGVIEMHVHADPDVRARCIDQLTLTQQCRRNGYRAIMYKCHDFCTADNAYLLRSMVPGIEVFGGIVLNLNYGPRVNVQAAKMATKITGHYCRCIWMPTYQSAFDMRGKKTPGVHVLDESGKVLPEVIQVMELCRDENIIFATGHSSPEESVILSAKAREVGVKKFVVTHSTQAPWFLSMDQAKKCLENGAYLEHCVLPYYKGPHSLLPKYFEARQTTMKEFAEYIALDPSHQFLATDCGMSKMPSPVDAMRDFIHGLRGAGVSEKDLDTVSRRVAAGLLGLD